MIDTAPMRAAAIPLGWSRDALPAGGSPSRVLGNGGPPTEKRAAGSAGSSPRPAPGDYAQRRRLGAQLAALVLAAIVAAFGFGIGRIVASEVIVIDDCREECAP